MERAVRRDGPFLLYCVPAVRRVFPRDGCYKALTSKGVAGFGKVG